MGHKRILATLCGLAAMSLSSLASAEMSVPYGWYLEGSLGSTTASNRDYGTGASSSTSGVGEMAALGYKFMPYFAGEFAYYNYANANITNSSGTKAARDRRNAFSLALKGIIPAATTGFEIFAKLGVDRVGSSISIEDAATASALGISSGSKSATGLYMGAGAQFYYMPELALVVQWTRAEGNKSTGNMELLSAGVSFIFS